MSEVEQWLQQLTKAVLTGKSDEARQSTYGALARGNTTNDILDALVEAVSILLDLNEVEELDQGRLNVAENAITASLQAVEDRLAKSEGKFGIKTAVGPVGLKAGSLLSLTLSAVLRSIGVYAVSLGKTQTPLELLRNSEELGVDLVVALLSRDDVERQLQSLLEEIDRGGFRNKFQVIPVAPGLSETTQASIEVARNPGEAISMVTEWVLKQRSNKGS